MDKETKKEVIIDGKPVTAETTFKVEKPDSTVDVTFTFDATALAGHDVVVFEKLFLINTCDGNWHNCILVDCTHCKTPGLCKEPGFLFCPDQEAVPYILPLSDARILFPRYPEPDECLCTMTVTQFLTMYKEFLNQKHFPSSYCPCMALLKAQEENCYEW